MRVALRRGRLEHQRASALVTSANDSLVGNLQPDYWRFEGGINVDGAVRAQAGPDLIDACLALPIKDDTGKRDLVRWTRAVKIGESSLVRCPTGSAVKTTAGSLEADYVIHAVAPDVELTFGRYKGRNSGAPEDLLRSAYRAAFKAAGDVECVACPALGAGVKGWDPAVTAAFGLEAAARAVLANEAPRRVDFVVDDGTFAAWARVFETLLGPGNDEWTIDPSKLVEDDVGDVLPLRDVEELRLPRTLWATESAGTRTTGGAWRWQPGDPRAV